MQPISNPVRGALKGYTSFEEALITNAHPRVTKYFDRLPFTTNHTLTIEQGMNPVGFVACSNGTSSRELGFRTFYVNTRGPYATQHGSYYDRTPGMGDGAVLGVIGDTSTPMRGDYGQGGVAPHGAQYFAVEDTDGFVYVEMDPVVVSAYKHVQMAGWAQVEGTYWQSNDHVKIWASDENSPPNNKLEVVLLDVYDLDDSKNISENRWVQYSAALPNFKSVTMRFGMDVNSPQKVHPSHPR